MSDRDNPAPNLDSHNAQTKLDTGAPASGDAEATLDSGPAADSTTSRDLGSIGPYRLVKKLGEGGMGQVWLAEQTAPIQRQVALKLIKVGMYDDSVLQRFHSERQSLAIMEHPSIAKVFDAGATPDGQPYFVMEYVPGLPVTDYCDQKRLKIRERLELFVKVCEGVQHAHQKAIMHRDLKPANILVVEIDGKPVPRIIDFGLAKAATPQVDGQTLFTQVGGWVGTPGYMSPEQADPGVVDVDTRTDVYSLGAVLYVLLTGFLPFETKDWRKQRFDEFLRRLREEDPPRPSTKIGMEKETSRPTAEARGAEPKHLVSLLRGDLDWITLKALEKDRARRYGTPSELAVDISRYLNNEPVVARPASTAYRVRKYVQRHKLGVSAVTAMALLLVSFAVVQAIQVRRVTQERDRVTRERDRADRVTDFMTNMFKVSDPSEARGNSITAREILDKASKEIDTGLAKDQVVQAQMMHVMGNVYANLGVYPRAQSLLEQAAKIRTRELGAEHTDTLASARELAWTLRQAGHYAEAEKLLRPTLEAQRRILGPDHPYTLESMLMMGNVERNLGNLSQAQPVLEEALNRRRRKLGPEHPDTLVAANELGYVLAQQGHYAEAEKLLRQTLETQRRVLGPDHPNTFDTMGRLSVLLGSEAEQGHREHFAEAEALGRETVEISRRVLGPDHRFTLTWQYHLASTLQDEKQYANAEKLLRETFEAQRGVLGPEHPDTLASMDGLALSLMYRGHYREAERLERQLLETWRRILGPESSEAADSIYELGFLAAYQGNRDRAFSLLREAVDHGAPPWLDLGIEEDENLKSLHGDPVSTPWLPQRARRCSAKEAVRDNLEDPILE